MEITQQVQQQDNLCVEPNQSQAASGRRFISQMQPEPQHSADGQRNPKKFLHRPNPKKIQVEPDAVRCVFLFTDGLANEGVTDAARLVSILKSMLDKSPTVRIYTFGFGADHSPSLLSQLAQAGGGTYY